MDWGSIIGGVLTGGTGGLLGIVGNVANTVLAMKQRKQDNDFQLALIPLQLNADVERAMVRPACLFLLACAVVALFTLGKLNEDMKDYIVQNIVTDFSMAVAWYFGARAQATVMQGFKSKAGK